VAEFGSGSCSAVLVMGGSHYSNVVGKRELAANSTS
jgi:hypothetical protein